MGVSRQILASMWEVILWWIGEEKRRQHVLNAFNEKIKEYCENKE